jgi:hypothetical protein
MGSFSEDSSEKNKFVIGIWAGVYLRSFNDALSSPARTKRLLRRLLVPKIDELAYVIDNHRPDLVFITETWLKPNIPDTVINIDNSSYSDLIERRKNTVECVYM